MWLAAVAFLALTACGGASPTLEKDVASLSERISDAAWGEVWDGLSSDQKEQIGRDEFVAAIEGDPVAAEAMGKAMEQAAQDPEPVYRAHLTLDDGSRVVLVLVDGAWIFETPITVFYGQSSPRETLASFIAAFRAGRWDVLARLVPSKYSGEEDAAVLEEAWGTPEGAADVERLIVILEEHVEDEIQVQGNRATLTYPEGQVTFLREGGRWVILDLD